MISVDWTTRVISVPQSYLTLVGADTYELDTDQFRLDLKDLEDDPLEGLPYPDTHNHNTEVVLGGVTYARFVEIINGYTVEFEDTGSPYRVNFVGSNNNIQDVQVLNGVSTAAQNSAGLIVVQSGGVTPADVWTVDLGGETAGAKLTAARSDAETILDLLCNNGDITLDPPGYPGAKLVTLYEDDGTTIRAQVRISADGLTRTRII